MQTARTSRLTATDALRMHTAPPAVAVCSRAATRIAVVRHRTAGMSALNMPTALQVLLLPRMIRTRMTARRVVHRLRHVLTLRLLEPQEAIIAASTPRRYPALRCRLHALATLLRAVAPTIPLVLARRIWLLMARRHATLTTFRANASKTACAILHALAIHRMPN